MERAVLEDAHAMAYAECLRMLDLGPNPRAADYDYNSYTASEAASTNRLVKVHTLQGAEAAAALIQALTPWKAIGCADWWEEHDSEGRITRFPGYLQSLDQRAFVKAHPEVAQSISLVSSDLAHPARSRRCVCATDMATDAYAPRPPATCRTRRTTCRTPTCSWRRS
jgi:hypothetical protein